MIDPAAPRPSRRVPLAVLALYAALVVAYSLATPMGEGPDEPSHVQYVMYLREGRRLPVVPVGGGARMPQGKHPPLYYLLGWALAAGDDFRTLGFVVNPHFGHDPAHPSVANAFVHPARGRVPGTPGERAARRMRLASLLAGLVTVWAAWRLGRLAWPEAPAIAAAAAAVTAFTPGFLFQSAVFNNDALAVAAASAALALAAALALGRAGPGGGSALGAALGVGLLAKLTTLMAWPLAALAAAVDLARRRDLRATWRAAWPALAVATLVAAPWVARGVRLYGARDPLGLGRWTGSIPHLARRIPLREELGTYLVLQYESFWGRFGWSSVRLPEAVYAAVGVVLVAALAGLVLLAWRTARGHGPPLAARIVLGLALAAWLLAYAQALRLGLRLDLVAAHGRYLYVALPAVGVLVASGLLGPLPARARPVAAAALGLAWLALGVGALVGVLMPAFRDPPPADARELSAATPADLAFGDALRLVGWRLDAGEGAGAARAPGDPALARLAPGAPLTLTLLWTAARPLWQDAPAAPGGPVAPSHVAFAHLVGAAGEVIARADAAPFGGRFPTGAWAPGVVYRQDLGLRVDGDAPVGRASLAVGAYPLGRPTARLGVRAAATADGTSDGSSAAAPAPADALILGPLVVDADETAPSGLVPRDEVFGAPGGAGAMVLTAAGVTRDDAGRPVTLSTAWRATEPPAARPELTLFVHLVAADGTLLATADGPPRAGGYPTSLWPAGRTIVDRRGLPPVDGAAALEIGWYDARDGLRLAAWRGGDGRQWPDGAVRVGLE